MLMIAALALWLIAIAAVDFGRRVVPNRLVLAGSIFALGALATGTALAGVHWFSALAGAGLAFSALLVFYMTGLLSAGDVKLAGALGLWFGMPGLLPIAAGAGLLAGVHAFSWLGLRYWARAWPLAGGLGSVALRRLASDPACAQIPYAGYLALSALAWTAVHSMARAA